MADDAKRAAVLVCDSCGPDHPERNTMMLTKCASCDKFVCERCRSTVPGKLICLDCEAA
jgi:hypothetical protein